jgi:hypothetical protein
MLATPNCDVVQRLGLANVTVLRRFRAYSELVERSNVRIQLPGHVLR